MFNFLIVAVLLLWIWCGALGIFAAMWVPICLVFLFLTFGLGLDFRITLSVFAIIIVLQLFKGNEPLFVSQKIEEQPEYFATPYSSYEKEDNDESWYFYPTNASWKWITKRINEPKIQSWLNKHNMTEAELIEIGFKNTSEWYRKRYHPDNPDYMLPR